MKKLHSIFLEPARTNGLEPLVNLPFTTSTVDGILKTNMLFSLTYSSYIYYINFLGKIAPLLCLCWEKPEIDKQTCNRLHKIKMVLGVAMGHFCLKVIFQPSQKPIVELPPKQLSMINDADQSCFVQGTNRSARASPHNKILYLSINQIYTINHNLI